MNRKALGKYKEELHEIYELTEKRMFEKLSRFTATGLPGERRADQRSCKTWPKL